MVCRNFILPEFCKPCLFLSFFSFCEKYYTLSVHIEDWRNRPLRGGHYPYVYVDGIYLRRNWGGEFENVAILVAIAVNGDGYREVLGAAEGMKEDKASWVSFFQYSCRAKLTFKCRAFATKFSRKRESHYQCSFKSCTLESANNPAERNSNERAKW